MGPRGRKWLRALTEGLLQAPWSAEALRMWALAHAGRRTVWVEAVVAAVLARWPTPVAPREARPQLFRLLAELPALQGLLSTFERPPPPLPPLLLSPAELQRLPLTHEERLFLNGAAAACLAGPWTSADMLSRLRAAVGRRAHWMPGVVRHVHGRWPAAPVEGFEAVAAVLWSLPAFLRPLRRVYERPVALREYPSVARTMIHPRWPVAPLPTPGDLARLLDADGAALRASAGLLRNDRLRYRWIWKPRGDRPPRLLEAPRAALKARQRRILRAILDAVPIHDAAHGFRRGRSVVTHAAIHSGQAVVVRLDLRDFFASINRPRVQALFVEMGYPPAVATLLAGFCTVRTPSGVLSTRPRPPSGALVPSWSEARARLAESHLPAGAPSSPAIANLIAWRLDARLAAAAARAGLRYSRYADDLTFSGDRLPGPFLNRVERVVAEEGFALAPEKTRVMRRNRVQRVCGVIVNVHPNPPRADFDRLKAILTNCRRHGFESQNREGRPDFPAWLAGRVGWMAQLNPARGARLRALLDAALAGLGTATTRP